MYYIGPNVHKRKTGYCVKDGSGRIHAEGSISATRLELDHWMRSLPQPWSAAMEATMFTGWIYDHLRPHAAVLTVAHPLMLRAIAVAKKKNDPCDAIFCRRAAWLRRRFASAGARCELVGLDFDPFLGSQDPADRYEARQPTVKSGTCSVGVWRTSPTDTAAKMDAPEAIAELKQQNGAWRFVNFTYSVGGPDLLHQLANLRRERQKYGSCAPR
jgi:hypothetical protein